MVFNLNDTDMTAKIEEELGGMRGDLHIQKQQSLLDNWKKFCEGNKAEAIRKGEAEMP